MNILVVGAGFSGATIARELAEAGHKITVIDVRAHVGGNAYDYVNNYGIRVHKFGPHLFHTNQERVFNYLSKFTTWIPYQHKVRALLKDGSTVVFPPNAETKKIVGKDNILDVLYRPYTKKMWGKSLEEVAPNILNRVPGRDDDVDLYFPDATYQALPEFGYTHLVRNMLTHPNITLFLERNFTKNLEERYDHIFNSMPIDVYYDGCYGELDYRSLSFNTVTIPVPKFQEVATVNFTHAGPETRVTEWKHLPNSDDNEYYTTLTFERPYDYRDNWYERFYPVNDAENKERYAKYAAIVNPKTTFIGRTGLYVYIDMDQAVNIALTKARKFLDEN